MIPSPSYLHVSKTTKHLSRESLSVSEADATSTNPSLPLLLLSCVSRQSSYASKSSEGVLSPTTAGAEVASSPGVSVSPVAPATGVSPSPIPAISNSPRSVEKMTTSLHDDISDGRFLDAGLRGRDGNSDDDDRGTFVSHESRAMEVELRDGSPPSSGGSRRGSGREDHRDSEEEGAVPMGFEVDRGFRGSLRSRSSERGAGRERRIGESGRGRDDGRGVVVGDADASRGTSRVGGEGERRTLDEHRGRTGDDDVWAGTERRLDERRLDDRRLDERRSDGRRLNEGRLDERQIDNCSTANVRRSAGNRRYSGEDPSVHTQRFEDGRHAALEDDRSRRGTRGRRERHGDRAEEEGELSSPSKLSKPVFTTQPPSSAEVAPANVATGEASNRYPEDTRRPARSPPRSGNRSENRSEYGTGNPSARSSYPEREDRRQTGVRPRERYTDRTRDRSAEKTSAGVRPQGFDRRTGARVDDRYPGSRTQTRHRDDPRENEPVKHSLVESKLRDRSTGRSFDVGIENISRTREGRHPSSKYPRSRDVDRSLMFVGKSLSAMSPRKLSVDPTRDPAEGRRRGETVSRSDYRAQGSQSSASERFAEARARDRSSDRPRDALDKRHSNKLRDDRYVRERSRGGEVVGRSTDARRRDGRSAERSFDVGGNRLLRETRPRDPYDDPSRSRAADRGRTESRVQDRFTGRARDGSEHIPRNDYRKSSEPSQDRSAKNSQNVDRGWHSLKVSARDHSRERSLDLAKTRRSDDTRRRDAASDRSRYRSSTDRFPNDGFVGERRLRDRSTDRSARTRNREGGATKRSRDDSRSRPRHDDRLREAIRPEEERSSKRFRNESGDFFRGGTRNDTRKDDSARPHGATQSSPPIARGSCTKYRLGESEIIEDGFLSASESPDPCRGCSCSGFRSPVAGGSERRDHTRYDAPSSACRRCGGTMRGSTRDPSPPSHHEGVRKIAGSLTRREDTFACGDRPDTSIGSNISRRRARESGFGRGREGDVTQGDTARNFPSSRDAFSRSNNAAPNAEPNAGPDGRERGSAPGPSHAVEGTDDEQTAAGKAQQLASELSGKVEQLPRHLLGEKPDFTAEGGGLAEGEQTL